MGDFSAVTLGLKISDAKASIINELRQLRKWQEDQRQEFQKKQLREHENILEQNLEQFYEQHKAMQQNSKLSVNNTDQSQSGSEVSFQDQNSSINGHMLNCFSDSSHDTTNFYRNKDTDDSPGIPISNGFSAISDIVSQTTCFAGNYLNEEISAPSKNYSVPKRPRPFLRKGAGLDRYKPKAKTNLNEAPKCSLVQKTDHVPQVKVLKLKPAIHSSTSPPRKINRVKFCEPVLTLNQEISDSRPLFFPSRDNPDTLSNQNEVEESNLESSSVTESQESQDKNSSCDLSLSAERKELAEFEILENCAQNSSFNSDSSVMQRVLNGEPLQPLFENPHPNMCSDTSNFNNERTEDVPTENASNFMSLKDFHSRKERLDNLISSFEPAIPSLERQLANSNRTFYEKSECMDVTRCSTPVDETGTFSTSVSEYDSSINLYSNSGKCVPQSTIEKSRHIEIVQDRDDTIIAEYRMNENNSYEKYSNVFLNDTSEQKSNVIEVSSAKSKLREKMEELENEIKNYQAERAQLAASAKERDMLIRQLKKERDEFQKNKVEEMNKFHSEMESEKQQFKREKETFNRLKKATLDHRNRKEREDLSTLKKENEKLQQELKKEKIKFNNETRKLKNQLAAAEKDRDQLKLQNITLEDQIEDLVAALKVRIALDGKSQAKGHSKTDKINKTSKCKKESSNAEENIIPNVSQDGFEEVHINVENNVDDISQTRPKVHFNLPPKIQESIPRSFLSDSDVNENFSELDGLDLITETTVDSQNKTPYEEIVYDDRFEKVHDSGEVETLYLNENIYSKKVSADGETITLSYTNGDVKEIFSDERTIYKFANGDIQRSFPSGLIVTELNNGQVQKKLPDGSEEVTFPDGTINYFYSDGSEKIMTKDGTVAHIDADGTKTYEFKNHIKEIHKDGNVRREYPDGGSKIIYSSGRQETRYPNGRIRIKDKDGNVVLDTNKYKAFTKLSR